MRVQSNQKSLRQDCLSVEGRPPASVYLVGLDLWPWYSTLT